LWPQKKFDSMQERKTVSPSLSWGGTDLPPGRCHIRSVRPPDDKGGGHKPTGGGKVNSEEKKKEGERNDNRRPEDQVVLSTGTEETGVELSGNL